MQTWLKRLSIFPISVFGFLYLNFVTLLKKWWRMLVQQHWISSPLPQAHLATLSTDMVMSWEWMIKVRQDSHGHGSAREKTCKDTKSQIEWYDLRWHEGTQNHTIEKSGGPGSAPLTPHQCWWWPCYAMCVSTFYSDKCACTQTIYKIDRRKIRDFEFVH